MKRKMFLLSTLALMVAGGVFWSCQKEDVLMNSTDDVVLKSVSSNYPESCNDVCIDLTLENVIYYKKSGSFVESIGSNSKYIGYTVYNTEDNFVVELSYTRTPASSGASSTIQVTVNGVIKSTTIVNGGNGVLQFPLAATWAACDEVVWALVETAYDGGQIAGGGTYELIGLCPSDCVESFSYVPNADGSYTFTYIPEEDMTDAELVFTFPQIKNENILAGWDYNGQTMQKKMDLEACKTYSWTVNLTCKDLNSPQNKWTDFKVNEVSMKDKFNLENIKCD